MPASSTGAAVEAGNYTAADTFLSDRLILEALLQRGALGLEAFRRLVNDRRFRRLPMLLETPKTEGRAVKSIAVDPSPSLSSHQQRSTAEHGG